MLYSALTETRAPLPMTALNEQVVIHGPEGNKYLRHLLTTGLLVLLSGIMAACASGSSPTAPPSPPAAPSTPVPTNTSRPAPTATPSPTATQTPTLVPVSLADVAFGYVTDLVEDLGPRESATEQELEAAEYLASTLEGFGYTVELQTFTVSHLSSELSSLEIDAPQPESIDVIPLSGSAIGEVSGELVSVGLARQTDFPEGGVEGKIVLAERGLITFQEKVTRAADAGAVAIVIYNNLPGNFQGVLFNLENIPTVAISEQEGRRIEELLSAGVVEVSVSVLAQEVSSSNVVAEKPGSSGEVVVLGGHYDTVANVSGANDNASGTAVLLTLAGELAAQDLPFTVQFVAFGSEELGLLGSNHYVASLTEAQVNRTKAMFNFDAVGTGESLEILGTRVLTDLALEQSDAEKIEVRVSRGLQGGGNDHQSFADAGIPVLMFFASDFSRIHSPADTLDFVVASILGDASDLALSLLKSEDFLRVLK